MVQRLLLIALFVSMNCILGCGKPDPRKRPGFVDTTDPREGLKQLQNTLPKSDKKPGKSPGAK
jgi:hypothetical protein